jgi:hypothetical protein
MKKLLVLYELSIYDREVKFNIIIDTTAENSSDLYNEICEKIQIQLDSLFCKTDPKSFIILNIMNLETVVSLKGNDE